MKKDIIALVGFQRKTKGCWECYEITKDSGGNCFPIELLIWFKNPKTKKYKVYFDALIPICTDDCKIINAYDEKSS